MVSIGMELRLAIRQLKQWQQKQIGIHLAQKARREMICLRIIAVVFRLCLAVLVITLAISAALVSTVAGGVLRVAMRLPRTSVTFTMAMSALTGATKIRNVGFLFGCCGINDDLFIRLFFYKPAKQTAIFFKI